MPRQEVRLERLDDVVQSLMHDAFLQLIDIAPLVHSPTENQDEMRMDEMRERITWAIV